MPADHATVAGDEALWAARRKRELRLKKRRQAAKDASWFGAPIVDEDGHKHYRGKKKGALARARRQAKHAHLDDHHAPSSTSSEDEEPPAGGAPAARWMARPRLRVSLPPPPRGFRLPPLRSKRAGPGDAGSETAAGSSDASADSGGPTSPLAPLVMPTVPDLSGLSAEQAKLRLRETKREAREVGLAPRVVASVANPLTLSPPPLPFTVRQGQVRAAHRREGRHARAAPSRGGGVDGVVPARDGPRPGRHADAAARRPVLVSPVASFFCRAPPRG